MVEIAVDSEEDEIAAATEADTAAVIATEVAEVAAATVETITVEVDMEVASRVTEVAHPTAIQATAHKAEATMLRVPMEMALAHLMLPPPQLQPSNNPPVLHSSRPTRLKPNANTKHGARITPKTPPSTHMPHMVATPQSWRSTNSKQRQSEGKQVLR
jgi:hypothetical protein